MEPRFKLIVEAPGFPELFGRLNRAVAPRAVMELSRARRVRGHLIFREDGRMVGLVTGLKVGAEKARSSFRAGEVAINPADGSLWFVLEDATSRLPMTPLGSLEGGAEAISQLSRAPRGARAILEVLS